MKHIAIFASGKGSNAEAIIKYFSTHPSIKVALVITNNPEAGVLKVASQHKIISAIVTKEGLENKNQILGILSALQIEFLVLAGFLQLIPQYLLQTFPKRIVNIHPALLPKYGGKGMYGLNVHRAICEAGEKESGISIHYVNENYDEGELIFQKKIALGENQTPEALADKILELEHHWYPQVIERLLSNQTTDTQVVTL